MRSRNVRRRVRGRAAMKPLPRGLRRGHDDSMACPHRDLSVCSACAKKHAPALVDVCGHHYWIPNEDERAELMALASSLEPEACDVCGCIDCPVLGSPVETGCAPCDECGETTCPCRCDHPLAV